MKIRFILQACLILLIQSLHNNSLHAQWAFIGSPETGRVLDYDTDGQRIFACATAGLLYSDDNGNSWSSIPVDKSISTANEIYAEDSTLYLFTQEDYLLGDYSHDLFRSVNYGLSWENIFPFAVDNVFEMHSPLVKGDTLLLFADDSIAISIDRGQSFTIILNTLSGIKHAFFHGDSLMVIEDDRLYSSSNLGETWNFIYTTLTSRFGLNVFSVDSVLFKLEQWDNLSEFENYISRSDDGGNTWVALGSFNDPFTLFPSFFGDDDQLFVSTNLVYSDFFRSLDGGKTWTTVENKPLAVSFSLHHNLLFAQNVDHVIFSKDNGSTFENHSSGLTAANILGIAGNAEHTWVNANESTYKKSSEDHWSLTSTIRNIESTQDGFFMAFVNDILSRSTDGGLSWEAIPLSSLGLDSYESIRQILVAGNQFFITGEKSFYSQDRGVTWSDFTIINELGYGLSHVGFGHGNYVASDYRENVLKSSDGVIWENIKFNLNSFGNNRIKMVHTHRGYFFAELVSGTFRLSPGSTQWTTILNPFPVQNPSAPDPTFIAMVSYDTMLIGASYGHGVFRSSDDGSSWSSINGDLNDFQTHVLKIVNGNLLLGVDGGVWKLELDDISAVHNVAYQTTLIFSASPSPANDELTIHLQANEMYDDVHLALFDTRGVLVTSQKYSTMDKISLDVHDLPSGVYYLHVRVGHEHGTISIMKN